MHIFHQIKYEPARVACGYTDRILWVNLSTREITIQELPPDHKDKYIGGRGYALKIIWDGATRKTRYDSPDNILVLASGPLGNEPSFPGTGKFIVGTISPLTDTACSVGESAIESCRNKPLNPRSREPAPNEWA